MNRRRALRLIAASGVASMVPARAADRVFTIGFLAENAPRPEGLDKPLADLGYVEGKSLRYEVRFIDDRDPRSLTAAASELVRARPDVMLTFISDRVEALAAATHTIPIVAGATGDPVGQGLAKSLGHPGGNVTGLSIGLPERAQMMIGLLRAVRPGLKRMVTFTGVVPPGVRNPWESGMRPIAREAEAAGIAHSFAPVATIEDVERFFDSAGDPLQLAAHTAPRLHLHGRVGAAAIKRRIVLMNGADDALMWHSFNFSEPERRIATIIDKILRGANPGDIPFEVPDRLVLVLNRKTAKAIGVTFPQELLLRATKIVG